MTINIPPVCVCVCVCVCVRARPSVCVCLCDKIGHIIRVSLFYFGSIQLFVWAGWILHEHIYEGALFHPSNFGPTEVIFVKLIMKEQKKKMISRRDLYKE